VRRNVPSRARPQLARELDDARSDERERQRAPRPVAPARGKEKGRVEHAIRYMRESFFAAREWSTEEELNAQAERG
jgi:transposase